MTALRLRDLTVLGEKLEGGKDGCDNRDMSAQIPNYAQLKTLSSSAIET